MCSSPKNSRVSASTAASAGMLLVKRLLAFPLERSIDMAFTPSWLSAALGLTLLLTGLSTVAVGEQPAEVVKPPGTGAVNDRAVQLVGQVICRDCTLDNMQPGEQPTEKLYELASPQGTIVLRVDSVVDNGRWQRISVRHRLTT